MFVQAEREGIVNEDEIVANCVLLLFAGHETTANLIAHGLNLLMTNPDQLQLLKAQPDLTQSAVEEMLRHDGPVTFVVRETIEPVTIAGHDLAVGEHLFLVLYTGNHDGAVFPDPMRFDITRTNNRHLGFGMGGYYCLGAALARVETHECFKILLDRFPDIHHDPDRAPAMRVSSVAGRQLETLPVRF
jgi:cytochrome P450